MAANTSNYSREYSLSELENVPLSCQSSDLFCVYDNVILKVGHFQVSVKSNLLARFSPYLRKVLAEMKIDGKSKNLCQLDRKIVTPEALGEIVNFFKTSKVTLNTKNIHIMSIAARHLQIPSLLSFCEQFSIEIIPRLSPNSFVTMVMFSVTFEMEFLKIELFDFLVSTGYSIIRQIDQTENFLALSEQEVKVFMLELNKRRIPTEISEFLPYAVISWIVKASEQSKVPTKSFSSIIRCLPMVEVIRNVKFLKGFLYIMKALFHQGFIDSCTMFLMKALENMPWRSGLYSFGGEQTTTVAIHCGLHDNWELIPKVSYSAEDARGVVIGKKVYLCAQERTVTQSSLASFTMKVFDCETHRWIENVPMPEFREKFAVAALGQHIYVCGGSELGRSTGSKNVFRYNILTKEWIAVASMQKSRTSHHLVEVNGHFYAIGGLGVVYSVERYDPASNVWTQIPNSVASTVRDNLWLSVVAYQGEIYAYNGSSFEAFSPKRNSWRILGKPREDHCRATLVSFYDELLLFGQLDNKHHTSSAWEVLSYDVKEDHWQTYSNLDASQFSQCVFPVEC